MLDLEYDKIDMLSGGSGSTIDVNSVNRKIGEVELDNVDVGAPSVQQFIDLTEAGIKTANDLSKTETALRDYTETSVKAVNDRLTSHEITYSNDKSYGHVKVDGKTIVSNNGIISSISGGTSPIDLTCDDYISINKKARMYPITAFTIIDGPFTHPNKDMAIVDFGQPLLIDTDYRMTLKGIQHGSTDLLIEIDITFNISGSGVVTGSWRNETKHLVGSISVGVLSSGNTGMQIGRWDITWDRPTGWLENVVVSSNNVNLPTSLFENSKMLLGQDADVTSKYRLTQDVYFDDNPSYVIQKVDENNPLNVWLENSIYANITYNDTMGYQLGFQTRRSEGQTLAFRQQVFGNDGSITFDGGDNLVLPDNDYIKLPFSLRDRTYAIIHLTDNTNKALYRLTVMPTSTGGDKLMYFIIEMLTDYTEV